MGRYNNINDMECTAGDFRVSRFIQSMDGIDFGNCGVPKQLQEYIKNDRKAIEDIFVCGDSMYILPKTRETAKYLFDVVMDGYTEDDYCDKIPLADEVKWVKLGDRYWLSLWWD